MKLERKHLKNYLGTGLKGIIADDGIIRELYCLYEYTLQARPAKHGFTYCQHEYFKPLLLPLSSLTEPMEDGSVPIVELAKMAFPDIECKFDYKLERDGVIVDYIEDGSSYVIDYFNFDNGGFFVYTYNDKFSHDYVTSSKNYCKNQLQLFEYLFANHFDVYGLIDAGLAIDKRTLKS